MRTLLSLLFASTLAASAAACSSSSTPASPTGDTSKTEPASASRGSTIVTELGCKSCHGPDLAGSAAGIPGYPTRNAPNLTPDKDTGVGEWSDDQLSTAIRTGVDDEGKMLCSIMPKFSTLAAADVASVIAFLRSLPAVSKEIPDSECPMTTK